MPGILSLSARLRSCWPSDGSRCRCKESVGAVNVAFGLAHAYQGVTGIIDEGLAGLLLGMIYLRTGRNLMVPIIAHGVQDSVDPILIFLGKYPGL